MFNIKNLLRSALMAIVLAGTAGAALATPYHVTINTAAFAGTGTGTGYLDFTFQNAIGAPSALATISNFSGAVGGVDTATGSISGGLPGTTTLSNATGLTELSQMVTFGSVFSFDLDFSGSFSSTIGDGTTLAIALFNSDYSKYLGADFNVLEFTLATPMLAGGSAAVSVAQFGTVATAADAVAAVPEPADWLLVLTGLVFVVYMTRLNGRTNARRRAAA